MPLQPETLAREGEGPATAGYHTGFARRQGQAAARGGKEECGGDLRGAGVSPPWEQRGAVVVLPCLGSGDGCDVYVFLLLRGIALEPIQPEAREGWMLLRLLAGGTTCSLATMSDEQSLGRSESFVSRSFQRVQWVLLRSTVSRTH
jgi:hypothetical protein